MKRNEFFYHTLLLIISLSLLITFIVLYYSPTEINPEIYAGFLKSPLVILMNFLPIFFFFFIIFLLFNEMWLAFLLSSSFFIGLSLINKYKMMYRDEALYMKDISLVKESLIMAGKYDISGSLNYLLPILAILGISIALVFIHKRKDFPLIIRMGILLPCLLLSLVFKFLYTSPSLYSKGGNKAIDYTWIQTGDFQSKGFIYSFIVNKEAPNYKLDYNSDLAKEKLESYSYKDIPEDKKVNIIGIMLESYNDFSKFPGVAFNIDVYENFHKIQEESISGTLVTNVFGGGTVDTERSFLTGYYDFDDYSKNTNSFVKYFKDQDYETEFMHPNSGSFYKRKKINEYLGFDYFENYDNRYSEVSEDYLSDKDFFKFLIEGYEKNRSSIYPYFNLTVTYDNHGPYSDEELTKIEYLFKNKSYDEATYNILNNYFSGIKKTDRALGDLFEYFARERSPVVIVLFGDHNPWLGVNNKGYENLGISMDTSNIDGFRNYYETPYIFWANKSAKEILEKDFLGENKDISPNFLMAELFQYMEWEGNEFMNYLIDLKDDISVSHKLYFKEKNIYRKNTDLALIQEWTEFLNIQKYYANKKTPE